MSAFPSRRLAAALGAVCAFAAGPVPAAEPVFEIPPPAQDIAASGAEARAVLAGGCFWGVQGVFEHVRGVKRAVAGYAGGPAGAADYETVSGGRSGHAEAVEITYDPGQISYGELLRIFFAVVHDPMQLNRQGPDVGTQYRSAVFAADAAQRQAAQAYIAQLNRSGAYPRPLATAVEDLKGFYPAEEYHQDYLLRHPESPYIVINDLPKVRNLARAFPARYRDAPVRARP